MEYNELLVRRIKAKLNNPAKLEEVMIQLLYEKEKWELINEYRRAMWIAEDYEPKSKSLWLRLKEKLAR